MAGAMPGHDAICVAQRGGYFAPTVLSACSAKVLVYVFDRSMFAFFTSGEDWLNTARTACAPYGSILPSFEYIGIVFFSAAT
jgi:hypothetical protein